MRRAIGQSSFNVNLITSTYQRHLTHYLTHTPTDHQPCSSCTLRGTQDSCVFPTKKRRGSVIRERDTPKPRSHPHPHPQPYPSSSSNDPSPRLQGLPPPPSSKRSRISSIDEHAAEASSAPTRRALAEINRLKRSIQQLEENIRDISSAGDGLEQVGPPATPEEQKNWEIVKAAVPERVVVEVLLEYMVTEVSASSLVFLLPLTRGQSE